MGILFLILFIFAVFILLDFILIEKWKKNITKSIDDIFDGIKVFLMVHIIDRFTNAFNNEAEEEEDGEDPEEIS